VADHLFATTIDNVDFGGVAIFNPIFDGEGGVDVFDNRSSVKLTILAFQHGNGANFGGGSGARNGSCSGVTSFNS